MAKQHNVDGRYLQSSRKRILTKIRKQGSLYDNYPRLAEEWHPEKNDGLTPKDVLAGSGMAVWWICLECRHEWKAQIVSRKHGAGCPKCKWIRVTKNRSLSEYKRIPTGSKLSEVCPHLVFEWDYEKNTLTPDEVTAGSHKKSAGSAVKVMNGKRGSSRERMV